MAEWHAANRDGFPVWQEVAAGLAAAQFEALVAADMCAAFRDQSQRAGWFHVHGVWRVVKESQRPVGLELEWIAVDDTPSKSGGLVAPGDRTQDRSVFVPRPPARAYG